MLSFLFLFSYDDKDTEFLAWNQSVAEEHKPKTCYSWNTFNHSMWITGRIRNDSLERPLQHQLLSFELSFRWGVLHTFRSGTGLGCLKTESFPSSKPGRLPHNWRLAFAVQKVDSTSSTRLLVRNAGIRALSLTCWVHICVLTKSPGGPHCDVGDEWDVVSKALFGEEKPFNFP